MKDHFLAWISAVVEGNLAGFRLDIVTQHLSEIFLPAFAFSNVWRNDSQNLEHQIKSLKIF